LEHHSHDRYAFLSSIQVYKPESLAAITLDVLRTVVSTGASKANQEPVEYSPHMHGRKSGVSDKKVNLHAKMWKKSGSDGDTAHLRMWVRVSNFIWSVWVGAGRYREKRVVDGNYTNIEQDDDVEACARVHLSFHQRPTPKFSASQVKLEHGDSNDWTTPGQAYSTHLNRTAGETHGRNIKQYMQPRLEAW
jgi:hypothetical protein